MPHDDHLTRDFVGYGRTPPHPQWPGAARIALNFCINYEEGSEPSFADGAIEHVMLFGEYAQQGDKAKVCCIPIGGWKGVCDDEYIHAAFLRRPVSSPVASSVTRVRTDDHR